MSQQNVIPASRTAFFRTNLALNGEFGEEPREDRQSLSETMRDVIDLERTSETSSQRPTSVVVSFLLATRLTPGPNLPAVGNGSDFLPPPKTLVYFYSTDRVTAMLLHS